MSRQHDPDPHLRLFARSLEQVIARYGDMSEKDITVRQRAQVENMVRLERKWRLAVIRHPAGRKVYREFVRHICEDRRNILAARPFFRERQGVFMKRISTALKEGRAEKLFPFAPNFQFIQFIMKARKWHPNSKVVRFARAHALQRQELIEVNIPLAISRARIFWRKTREGHLEYMDLVQICVEGLAAGVDKFCLPYSPVFRAVAIGRMIGNLIDQFSETLIHFYPSDKRKLYRANKAVGRMAAQGINFDRMVEEINEGIDPRHWTCKEEVQDLMAASSPVGLPTLPVNDEDPSGRASDDSSLMADPSPGPDMVVEEKEALEAVRASAGVLSVVERKMLRLKGVEQLEGP